MSPTLSARQSHNLDDLRHHWTPPFRIGCYVSPDGNEIWTACAAEPGEVIAASSAAALRLKIRNFYDQHPELHQRGATERSDT